MEAYIILEDGTILEGESIGSTREVISEFVFNTSMAGYLEVLTDPSYAGQSVIMTYPLIGNYGICLEDQESSMPHVEGLVVNELSRMGSNFRSEMGLEEYLIKHDIPAIQGVDTRYLTKILRQNGCMNGMITTHAYTDIEKVLTRIKEYKVQGVVDKMSCKQSYTVGEGNYHVALYDFGTKQNIVRSLVAKGCKVTVFPACTTAKEIIDSQVDGIMLSNGPGDPEECTNIIQEIQKLAATEIPIFAICLGHQLMALAYGFETEKMKYGHHGANHPVQDLTTGRVYISTQNHNYVVKEDSLDPTIVQPWFINVNDKTIEGLKYVEKNIQTVQFHPEACAGPQDMDTLFAEFIQMMEEYKHAKR